MLKRLRDYVADNPERVAYAVAGLLVAIGFAILQALLDDPEARPAAGGSGSGQYQDGGGRPTLMAMALMAKALMAMATTTAGGDPLVP